MRPEICIIQKVPDAVRTRKWGVSATMSLGFSPLSFLIGDLYGGSISSPDQGVDDLYPRVSSEGVILLSHLNPSLILVRKTNSPEEITKLARQLVRIADQNRLEDLVLDHYRMLNFSKYVNPALALPMLHGIQTTPTVSLKRIYIFADQGGPHDRKNHAKNWQSLLEASKANLPAV